MTSPPIFPTLPGEGWTVRKTPTFSSLLAQHASGRESRAQLYSAPLYVFELTFDGLASSAAYSGLFAKSLQMLMGLYEICAGRFGTFLYRDPSDCTVKGQAIAFGDGATAAFAFVRDNGPARMAAVSWVTYVNAIYLDGVATNAWTLTQPATLTLASAPAAGVGITADFEFAFLCRFDADEQEFQEDMQDLWSGGSLKFRQVRTQ